MVSTGYYVLALLIIIIVILVGIVGYLMAYCVLPSKITTTTTTIKNELFCQSKNDCLPAQCCHPTSCINRNYKSVCNLLCTQECQPGTMDCGQGSCDCINNVCTAVVNSTISEPVQACINSGGTVETSLCCQSSGDFPNTCLIGACGCSPSNSHEVKVCECPTGTCFNGNGCVKPQEMINIYCVKDNCSPHQIPIGAGTLVMGCYRNQTDCLSVL